MSCRCCSIGLERVNPRVEIQGGLLTVFNRSLSRKCPTLLPGQMTDFREALRRWQYFFYVAKKPLVGQGLLNIMASRSHPDTPHSVGLHWMSSTQRPLPDKTHHSKQTSVSSLGFKPATLASEWPQTHALDGAASGIGRWYYIASKIV